MLHRQTSCSLQLQVSRLIGLMTHITGSLTACSRYVVLAHPWLYTSFHIVAVASFQIQSGDHHSGTNAQCLALLVMHCSWLQNQPKNCCTHLFVAMKLASALLLKELFSFFVNLFQNSFFCGQHTVWCFCFIYHVHVASAMQASAHSSIFFLLSLSMSALVVVIVVIITVTTTNIMIIYYCY